MKQKTKKQQQKYNDKLINPIKNADKKEETIKKT